MPAVQSGKVLVTGASGYIGAWTAKYALEAGFHTVATVRSTDKGEYLVKLFNDPKFSYVIVEDIGAPGAFDKVIKDGQFDAVLHTASPFHFNADDPQELIVPALQGTTSILKAVHAHSPNSVKRVIVTSSIAAVMNATKTPPVTFTEKDWNENSEKMVKEQGKAAPAADKYRASKSMAEKAAWNFVSDNKPKWDLACINPGLVEGPIIHQCDSPEKLNTSVKNFYDVYKNGCQDLPRPGGNACDVRDVAEAHIKALQVPEAGGNRFIISIGPFCYQDFTDILKAKVPDWPHETGAPGAAAAATDPSKMMVLDGSQASRILGLKYRSKEEFTMDMYHSIVQREKAGWK